jgi:hypothetical protein
VTKGEGVQSAPETASGGGGRVTSRLGRGPPGRWTTQPKLFTWNPEKLTKNVCSQAFLAIWAQNEIGKTQNKLCIYGILAQGKKWKTPKPFDFSLFQYNSMQNEIGKT